MPPSDHVRGEGGLSMGLSDGGVGGECGAEDGRGGGGGMEGGGGGGSQRGEGVREGRGRG